MFFNKKNQNYEKMKVDRNISSEDYVLNMYMYVLGLIKQITIF